MGTSPTLARPRRGADGGARPRGGRRLLRRVLAVLLALVALAAVALLALPTLLAVLMRMTGAGTDVGDLPPLAERSVIEAADGSVLAELHGEIDREVVRLVDVPPHVREAVLAAEDRRFYRHEGFDRAGIARALWANLRAGGIEQGGSTITQQLVKRNLVGQERTVWRKVKEVFHAVALEQRSTKDELLERYLNEVYFGSGAYGIAAAARQYFGKDVADLDVGEAAVLAAVIRAPSRLDPRTNAEAVARRRDAVLATMVEDGNLAAATATRLAAAPVQVAEPPAPVADEPFVADAVTREFLANPAFGETREERAELLLTGGLRLRTTLDPRLQAAAREVVDGARRPDGRTGALVAVDPRDGGIRALYTGADYQETQFDVATQGRRQPGSAFKPFVLAAALEAGVPVGLLLQGDSPAYFEGVRGWEDGDAGEDGVRNFGDASHGLVDLRQALARSVNTAFAELALLVGPEQIVEVAEHAGIDVERALGEGPGPAIALGGLERGVTPLEMASAFGLFATAGRAVPPHLISRVVDGEGATVFTAVTRSEQRLHPAVAATSAELLQEVVRSGTGTAARLQGWAPAGKTGTTQESADAWFVGAVPVLSTAVWVGHPEGQVPMPGATGGGTAAPLWTDFMQEALDGVEPVDFPEVDASLSELQEPVEVPDVRGEDEDDARRRLAAELLIAEPVTVRAAAPEGRVVWQQPPAGVEAAPGDRVRIGVSTGRPPAPDPAPEPEAPAPSPGPPSEGSRPPDEDEDEGDDADEDEADEDTDEDDEGDGAEGDEPDEPDEPPDGGGG